MLSGGTGKQALSRPRLTQLLPSALARGSESRIYSHKVRTYVRGGSRSGMSRRMSLHTTDLAGHMQGYVRHTYLHVDTFEVHLHSLVANWPICH